MTAGIRQRAHDGGEEGPQVIAMQPDSRTANPVPDELLHPSYWLVSGLDWHGDGAMAEAAVAIVPTMIPRDELSEDARQVLGCADLYALKHRLSVVLFSDLSRMFGEAGTSWSRLGVNWQNALQELRSGQFPALFLAISERAHLVICGSESSSAVAASSDEPAENERDLVRKAVAQQLARYWPPYMQSAASAGRIQVA
jgi:hypothetical protein